MKNAYEREEEFSPEGKCLRRKTVLGPSVIAGLLALCGLLSGKPIDWATWIWTVLRR